LDAREKLKPGGGRGADEELDRDGKRCEAIAPPA
jgi:hypothetical protein